MSNLPKLNSRCTRRWNKAKCISLFTFKKYTQTQIYSDITWLYCLLMKEKISLFWRAHSNINSAVGIIGVLVANIGTWFGFGWAACSVSFGPSQALSPLVGPNRPKSHLCYLWPICCAATALLLLMSSTSIFGCSLRVSQFNSIGMKISVHLSKKLTND